jgi:4-carboxymuconolactone decarboxylase
MAKTNDPRMQKALEMLHAIEDKDAADAVVSVLNELAPDYAKATVAYAFGDTYARTKQLALRDREITTIAALAAMGNALPQLKVHIRSGLKVGLSQQEIVEIIGHVGVYAGFPAAANAYFAMKEALAESAAARQAAAAKGGGAKPVAGKVKSVKAKPSKAAPAAKAKPAKAGKKG